MHMYLYCVVICFVRACYAIRITALQCSAVQWGLKDYRRSCQVRLLRLRLKFNAKAERSKLFGFGPL